MSGVSTTNGAFFNRHIRSFNASPPISQAVTLCQSSGNPAYNPATASSIYAETATPLNAFRATVTEKQANERIQAGSVRWDFDASQVPSPIRAGDRITDASEVVWSVYEIGDPDPTNALTRVYTQRSPT